MKKIGQRSTRHADLAALPAGSAWRIFWMRFIDDHLGPAVRDALGDGKLLKIGALLLSLLIVLVLALGLTQSLDGMRGWRS